MNKNKVENILKILHNFLLLKGTLFEWPVMKERDRGNFLLLFNK